MVKGLSKKVIIVKSPDPKIFEQAIFILRDDYLNSQGISQKELIKQARCAARGYVGNTERRGWIYPLIFGIIGALLISLVWAVIVFMG